MQEIFVTRLANQLSAFKVVLSSVDLLGYVALMGRNLACSHAQSMYTVHVSRFTRFYIRLVRIFNNENAMYNSGDVHVITTEK